MDENKSVLRKQTEDRTIEHTREFRACTPDVDILESGEAITVVADLPGVEEKALEVELENGVLTVRGVAAGAEPEGLAALHREFGAKEFRRSFSLGADIDRDRIRAEMRNGVLKVTLPKSEAARPRRIAVASAEA